MRASARSALIEFKTVDFSRAKRSDLVAFATAVLIPDLSCCSPEKSHYFRLRDGMNSSSLKLLEEQAINHELELCNDATSTNNANETSGSLPSSPVLRQKAHLKRSKLKSRLGLPDGRVGKLVPMKLESPGLAAAHRLPPVVDPFSHPCLVPQNAPPVDIAPKTVEGNCENLDGRDHKSEATSKRLRTLENILDLDGSGSVLTPKLAGFFGDQGMSEMLVSFIHRLPDGETISTILRDMQAEELSKDQAYSMHNFKGRRSLVLVDEADDVAMRR